MTTTLTAEALQLNRGFFKFPFVKSIEKEFGFKGSKLLLVILFEVTETGFETVYNKPFRDKVAERNNVSERLVDMIVHRMVKNEFLDRHRYDADHVLAIPSRYMLSKSLPQTGHLPYFFIKPSSSGINSEETEVISEETKFCPEETTNNDVFTLK